MTPSVPLKSAAQPGRRKLPVPMTRMPSTHAAARPSSRIMRRDENGGYGSGVPTGIASSSAVVTSQNTTQTTSAATETARPPLPDFSTSITVAVRCRGRNDREVSENSAVVLETDGMRGKSLDLVLTRGHSDINRPPSGGGAGNPPTSGRKTYTFDTVFSAAADQRSVFEGVVAGIVDEVLSGLNCTIFAYGQTGTGKTYTMAGDISSEIPIPASAGIIPRVFHYLFGKLDGASETSERRDRTVKCSYLELYNEELRDLLADEADGEPRSKLKMFDERSKGRVSTVVQGLEEEYVDSAVAGIELLRVGSDRRETAATGCNDRSSRSHSVFTITVLQSGDGDDQISLGKLNLVDLAGSENIQRSGAESKRATEAGLINRSLLALGRVINSLVDGTGHVPYRESKLTRLLQDSLGGHTKTCMIATVSPAQSNLEETISTLDYAFRAKNIRNAPQFNAALSKRTLLRDFAVEISRLKGELNATRQRNGVYLTAAGYDQLLAESESRRIEATERAERVNALEGHVATKEQEVVNLQSVVASLKNKLADREGRLAAAEEDARRQAETAAEALAAAAANIDSLDGSLRRRAGIEAKNRIRWQRMRRAVGAGVARVEEMVATAREGHVAVVKSFRDHVLEAVTRARTDMELVAAVPQIHEVLLDKVDVTYRDIAEGGMEIGPVEQAVQQLRVVDTDALLRTAEACEARVAELSQSLELEVKHGFEAVAPDVTYCFDDVISWGSEQCNAATALERDLVATKEELIKATEAFREDIQDALAHVRSNAATERAELAKRITDLIMTTGENADAELGGMYDMAGEAVDEWDNNLRSHLDARAKEAGVLARSATDFVSNGEEKKAELEEMVRDKAEATVSTLSGISKSIATAHSETLTAATSVQSRFASGLSELDGAIDSVALTLQQQADVRTNSMSRFRTDLEDRLLQLEWAREKDVDTIGAIEPAAVEAVESVSRWADQLDVVANGVTSLVAAIDASAGAVGVTGRSDSSGWEEYVPSGKTPVKPNYSPAEDESDGVGAAVDVDVDVDVDDMAGSAESSPVSDGDAEVEVDGVYHRPGFNPVGLAKAGMWPTNNALARSTLSSTTTTTVPTRDFDGSARSSTDPSGNAPTPGVPTLRRPPSLGGLLKELDMNMMMDLNGMSGSRSNSGSIADAPVPASTRPTVSITDRKRASARPPISSSSTRPVRQSSHATRSAAPPPPSLSVSTVPTVGIRRKRVGSVANGATTAAVAGATATPAGTVAGNGADAKVKRRRIGGLAGTGTGVVVANDPSLTTKTRPDRGRENDALSAGRPSR